MAAFLPGQGLFPLDPTQEHGPILARQGVSLDVPEGMREVLGASPSSLVGVLEPWGNPCKGREFWGVLGCLFAL